MNKLQIVRKRLIARGLLVLQLSSYLVIQPSAVNAAMYSRQIDIPERIQGAKKVVVARIQKVTTRWETNSYGDELIISRLELKVDETLKGNSEATVEMDIEGGTIDGLTMRVSDMPEMKIGDKAVVFLKESDKKIHKPHLRGRGILKLDTSDAVQNSSLRLNDIRRMAGEQKP
jgi:hypothetical protein